MQCPKCNTTWISVLESRHTTPDAISRRRKCKACDHVWATAEVIVPDEAIGGVMGDLSARRAVVSGMTARPGRQAVSATVPVAGLFGYATHLRSLTQGRGDYSMSPEGYGRVPPSMVGEITGRA